MTRLIGYGCLLCFLAQAALAADPEYTLKIKEKKKGDVVSVKRIDISDESLVISNKGRALFNYLEKESENTTFWEQTLLKQPGKAATKLKRGYGEARYNKKGNKAGSRPYEGKVLDIAQEDGAYQFTIDRKEIESDDAAALEKEFNHLDGISEWKQYLPAKAVAIKERWNIKRGPWLKYIEETAPQFLEVNSERAAAHGQLMKIYKKNDRIYGLIDLNFDIPVKIKYEDLKIGNQNERIILSGSIEGCLDGTAHDLVVKKNWIAESNGDASGITFRYVFRRIYEESAREGAK